MPSASASKVGGARPSSTSEPRARPGPSTMQPIVLHPVRYMWTNRSTHSDVMATSTTTEISVLGGSTKAPSGVGGSEASHGKFSCQVF